MVAVGEYLRGNDTLTPMSLFCLLFGRWKEILLFGSDAAKGELKESLEGDWFGGIVEVLETCINKLTDRQMMKVRENFQK